MNQFYNISAVLFMFFVANVHAMNAADFNKFLYQLSGNFSNTLNESARGPNRTTAGFIIYRPIANITALNSTYNERYFFYYFARPDAHPGQDMTYFIRRVAFENSTAVMYDRYTDSAIAPDEDADFAQWFQNLHSGRLWRREQHCTFIFDVTSPGGNEFLGRSRVGCRVEATFNLSCNGMLVTTGREPYPDSKIYSTINHRFPTPAFWNVTPAC